jgi:4-amino-4-deoxy-L-arabinose transferase-like glycosyltransferase
MSAAREGGATLAIRLLWPLLAGLLVIRLALAASCNLLPDEAFYWVWTRHLAGGYLDHPPMIAYLMWLSTRVLGNTQIGVRLPCVLMSLASIALIVALARRQLKDDRAAGYVAIMWLVSPLAAVTGLIFTPDTPSIFFSICALACAVGICADDNARPHAASDPDFSPSSGTPGEGWGGGYVEGAPFANSPHPNPPPEYRRRGQASSPQSSARRRTPILWLLFGLFCGLALLSKYPSVVVPAGVTLALLSSPSGRRHFRQPWIYLSGFIALAAFSPVIYWNATHHWASFLFQLHHGASEGITEGVDGAFRRLLVRAGGFGEFVAGQAFVWTPVLFVISIYVLFGNWRNYFRLRDSQRILLWCATLPLVLFGWAATRSHTELNWPAFAYFPLSILIGGYLSDKWSLNRVNCIKLGCIVAAVSSILVHQLALPGVPGFLMKLHLPMPHNVTDLHGWPEYGQQISQRAAGMPVICNRHQDAGEAEFYMPGQPPVWCEGVGSRPTAYDYIDSGRPDYTKIDRLIWVGSHEDEFMEKFHYTHTQRAPGIEMPGPGKHRSRPVYVVSK